MASIFTTFILLQFASLITCFNDNFKAQLVCTDTHMVVYITNGQGDFSGIIYTEGSFQKDGCHIEVDQSRKIMFEIPYDGCLSKKEDGIYSNVLIIQKHARILTNEDAAFLVKCDETNMHRAQIVVTETMMTMSKKNSEGSEDYFKPHIKQSIYDKKTKTLYNDKETITYVGSAKNSSSSLVITKQ